MNDDILKGVDLQRIHSLLRTLTDLAKEASLTGHLQDGTRYAISQYNAILDHLIKTGLAPAGLFQTLTDTSNYDELGVAGSLLAAYIKHDMRAAMAEDSLNQHNIRVRDEALVRVDEAGLPELQELQELRRLGAQIRERLGGQ